ncbi:MAG: DevC protein [Planctomycetaceae bacterium]|nr:DevC protein [Planctomycetaceae bacterium]
MPRPPAVPLAWSNLAHDRVRFALFTAGIGFAVVLMGVQLGIMNAMLDSNTVLLQRVNADFVLVSPTRKSLLFREGVNRRRAEQALQVEGVASIEPLFVDYMLGMLRHTADEVGNRTQTRRVRVVGVDPDAGLLNFPGVPASDWERLRVPGTALYDRKSRKHPDQEKHPGETVFGKLADGVQTELAGKDITLVGSGFDLGFDFGTDGTIVVSDRTYAEWLRAPYSAPGTDPLAEIDLVAVRLQPGADVDHVQERLRAIFSATGDVDVLTVSQMVAREKWFWWSNTPIGFAFGAGVVLGFVVGMVICYQILSSDIADHVAEYATLKAIGYPNRYLSLIVLQEALILAGAGFVPGLLVILGVYALLTDATGLAMELSLSRAGLVLILTVVMCTASAWLAVGKAKKVDPADVF